MDVTLDAMGTADGGEISELDESLFGIMRLFHRPVYRKRYFEGLSSPVEFAVLRLLRTVERLGEEPSVGDVAESLVVAPSTASRLVDRAVNDGYLDRQLCEDNRRRTVLRLTASGRRILDEATARRRELLAEVLREWPGADVRRLEKLLSRLQQGFDRLEGTA